MNKKVLLTGISGYIGLHCAKILLEKGYTVVGTVRSTKKEEEVTEVKRIEEASSEPSSTSSSPRSHLHKVCNFFVLFSKKKA